MSKASAVVTIEWTFLVDAFAALTALAKCRERVVLVLAIPNCRPIFAPRGFNARVMVVVLLFLLLMIELPSKASNLHLLGMSRGERPLPCISRPDVLAQFGESLDSYWPGFSA